ncbi:hypothetical protein B0H19DRAFT_1245668 [Mycena capillaripes]|nr:hypothetical protein B0H19DRAFT_1245668 [Mycena capillaripes]
MRSEDSSSESLCQICGSAQAFRPSPPNLFPDAPQLTEIQCLLRANTLIVDTSRFERFISDGTRDLLQYDAEIERIKKILDEVVSQRDSLAANVDGCRSLFSPVRWLPSELLVEIFDMCTPASIEDVSDNDTLAEELERRATGNITQELDVGHQVCSYWRTIALGTPRLWSRITLDTTFWWDSDVAQATWMSTLKCALNRGGSYPLTLRAYIEQGHPEQSDVVDALVKHVSRWREVVLCIDLQLYWHPLTGVKGNLPLLETLHIVDSVGPREIDIDIFEVAPRLTNVTFCGEISRIPILPWNQLKSFDYRVIDGVLSDLFGSLFLICRMSADTKFALHLHIVDTASTSLPPIVSNVSILSMSLIVDAATQSNVAGEIFKALTLPRLKRLEFHRNWYAFKLAPLWDTTQFLAFASRSSLHVNLTELEIHILITDDELLASLPVLPLLQKLIISDCGGTTENILITDNLLRRLTWTADNTCLIPRLHFFFITSLFKFTDDALWNLLASRIVPGRSYGPPYEPFQLQIWSFSGSVRELSAEVLARITHLTERRELSFKTRLDPTEPKDILTRQPSE